MTKMIYRSVEEFSQKQVVRFDTLHNVLTEYNRLIGTDDELPLPGYSEDEMADYSCYRELLLAKEFTKA